MGARSGNNYLSAMRKLRSEVWLGGERIADPTTHPAWTGGQQNLIDRGGRLTRFNKRFANFVKT